MRDDPTLDFEGKAMKEGQSGTSKIAARRIMPRTGTQRARVLDLLSRHPQGLTDEQMQDALGMNPSTQRPRRVELVEQGWVEDSGERRRTRSGHKAVVWRFVP